MNGRYNTTINKKTLQNQRFLKLIMEGFYNGAARDRTDDPETDILKLFDNYPLNYQSRAASNARNIGALREFRNDWR